MWYGLVTFFHKLRDAVTMCDDSNKRASSNIQPAIQTCSVILFFSLLGCANASDLVLQGGKIRVSILRLQRTNNEVVQIRDGDRWIDACMTTNPVTRVSAKGQVHNCILRDARLADNVLTTQSDCGVGSVKRELRPGPDADTIAVKTQFTAIPDAAASSVEDRIYFAPLPRRTSTPLQGPLDLVWSQNIKAQKDQLTPHWAFKSPAIFLQQGRVFAAIVPRVDLLKASDIQNAPPALDLDVTSEERAWLSYGIIPSEPTGHSYFRRLTDAQINISRSSAEYNYWIVASAQPERLGYRRISQLLWQKFGSPALRESTGLQRNVRRPELLLFNDWRSESWTRYANEKYWEMNCGSQRCGALTSNRNPWGKWDDAPREDAWFNSWFQNLRTAYGWYLFARRTNNSEMKRKAEQILNLALHSPQHDGLFATIYLHDTNTWLREDGWAGFPDDYHTFCRSWTGYWMLRWATDLLPGRRAEILGYLHPYADFLLRAQQPNGNIPSWFDSKLKPRSEFRDFNAETTGSALFLSEFSGCAKDPRYLRAAIHSLEFISREVLPRQRWYDFETFLSCARKPFTFYDPWTAQYPQNNLSQMQAVQAYFRVYQLTKQAQYLTTGEQILDYLLLTQQVWSHPLLSPHLLGGTTTQNTDAEWSDARQAYLAALLLDYYLATGRLDYLERAVAAARSGFAVAPWENWAHTGHMDEPGALTGFHWGTGSEMTAVEMMASTLGDAFVNVGRRHGVGFNACSLEDLRISGTTIAFTVRTEEPHGVRLVRFAGLNPQAVYKLVINRHKPVVVRGQELLSNGYSVLL